MLENLCQKVDLSSMYLQKKDLDEETSNILSTILKEQTLLQEMDVQQESLLEQLDWIALSTEVVVHAALIER